MMLRSDFEMSGYKAMNIKHYEDFGAAPRGVGRASRRESAGKPSLAATVAGVLCVAGVFAMLGLLYSIG